jgi:hypothetical protein
MADAIRHFKKASTLSAGVFAASFALLAFGAGTAHADEDTGPAPDEIASQGIVSSRQASGIAVSARCEVNASTLGTSSVYSPEGNVPKQVTEEVGPESLGSDGWIALGVNPSNPWNAEFFNGANTGPQCDLVRAPGATGRGLQ